MNEPPAKPKSFLDRMRSWSLRTWVVILVVESFVFLAVPGAAGLDRVQIAVAGSTAACHLHRREVVVARVGKDHSGCLKEAGWFRSRPV